MPHSTVEGESLVGLGLSLPRSLSSMNWVFFVVVSLIQSTQYILFFPVSGSSFREIMAYISIWKSLPCGLLLAASLFRVSNISQLYVQFYLEVDGNWVVSERWKSCHRLVSTEVAKNHETWAPSFLQALGFQGYFNIHSYMFLWHPISSRIGSFSILQLRALKPRYIMMVNLTTSSRCTLPWKWNKTKIFKRN